MNNSLLDERLKKSCGSRIAEDGKIDIMNEFRFAAEEIGLSPEDSGGTITFKGMDPIVNSTIPLGTGAAISLMLKATGRNEGMENAGRRRTGYVRRNLKMHCKTQRSVPDA